MLKQFDDAHFRETATEIEEFIEAYTEANEVEPQLHQLLGALLRALSYASQDFFANVASCNVQDLQPNKGQPASALEAGILLTDDVFEEAYHVLESISKRMEKKLEAKPKLNDFCKFFTETLKRFFPKLLGEATAIKGVPAKKQAVTPKPGDVFAVPLEEGGQFLGLVITENQFGMAFGFFLSTEWQKPLSPKAHPPLLKYPIYATQGLLKKGKWKIIDHNEALLELFPRNPEIFYAKRYFQDNPSIGTFGSGKSPDGAMRHLSEGEATEIGLLDNSYRDMILDKHVPRHLQKALQTL